MKKTLEKVQMYEKQNKKIEQEKEKKKKKKLKKEKEKFF